MTVSALQNTDGFISWDRILKRRVQFTPSAWDAIEQNIAFRPHFQSMVVYVTRFPVLTGFGIDIARQPEQIVECASGSGASDVISPVPDLPCFEVFFDWFTP